MPNIKTILDVADHKNVGACWNSNQSDLEGAGFEVVDLGINNSAEKYLAALEEHQPDFLGMSALLTTTMPYMKVVIDTLKQKGLRDKYESHHKVKYDDSAMKAAAEDKEVRVTVLGHVQRGGRPSAFDRTLSTLMGFEAVNTILAAKPEDEPVVIGIRNNRMTRLPLMESVRAAPSVIASGQL